MRKFHTLIFLLLITLISNAQSDRYWVGPSGGNWSANANWSLTSGGAGGAGSPTSAQNAIFDQDAVVTLDASPINVNSLTIKQATGGVGIAVTFNSTATRTFTVNAGSTPTPAFKVESLCSFTYAAHSSSTSNVFTLSGAAKGELYGTMNVAGPTATVTPRVNFTSANNLTVKSGGKLVFGVNSNSPLSSGNQSYVMESGAILEVYRTSFQIPDGTYDANSTTRFLGFTSGATVTWAGFPQAQLGNIEYNCAGQTTAINLTTPAGTAAAPFVVKGNFKVLNTNGQELRFCSNTAGFLQINGNLEVAAGSKFSLTGGTAAGTVYLKGDLIAAGEITEGGSATTCDLVFNGTSPQSATFAAITNDSRFTINNPAGVTVNSDWIMPNSSNSRILLTSGNINMGSNLLNIQSPTSTALNGGTANSHVIGKVRRATNSTVNYVFPVSNSATEVALVRILPAAASANVFEVTFTRPNPYNRLAVPAGVINAANYVWDILRISGTDNADVTFAYGDPNYNFSSGNSGPDANLRVLHWNGTSWDDFGGTGNGIQITATNVSTFSPFTLGTTGPVGLPVNLLSFAGRNEGATNKLTWVTANEQDNKGFHVERSLDGQRFASIGFVSAMSNRGNSSTPLSYSFSDNDISGAKQYYRLRQEDISGRSKNSQVVMVQDSKDSGLSILTLYPNPVADRFVVQVQSPSAGIINLSVIDQAGRIAIQTKRQVNTGINPIEFNVNQLMAGVYFLRIENEKGEVTQQAIVK